MTSSHIAALVAGLLLPIQAALKNKLTSFSGSAVITSLCSFAIGTLALLAYNLTSVNAIQKATRDIWLAPGYAWLGGLAGSFYVVSTLVVAPRIGMALTFTLVVAGQLCMSLAFDHFGWMGISPKPLTWAKTIGLLLVLIGPTKLAYQLIRSQLGKSRSSPSRKTAMASEVGMTGFEPATSTSRT